MPCVWPFVLKLDGGTQDCSLILIHSSRNTGLKPCAYIHPPKKQDCCTLEAADCRRNNPDKHNFYCKWALPLLEMEPDEWWKSQSMVKHAPLAEEEDEEDLLIHCFHPLPFSTFLCSPYHLLHRLKYFITSWFVCSKFCLLWYQYQRKCRLLLSQLVDLFLRTPGYFVFHFSLQLEAVGEKEPACFHNNTSWNCEDPPQIGEKKRCFLCSFECAQAGERWLNCYTDREKCLCSWYLLSLCGYFILYLLWLYYFRHRICPHFYQWREW